MSVYIPTNYYYYYYYYDVYAHDEYARLFIAVEGSEAGRRSAHTSHTALPESGEKPLSGGLGRGHRPHTPGLSIIKSSP